MDGSLSSLKKIPNTNETTINGPSHSVNFTNSSFSLADKISPVKVLTWTTVTLIFCFIGCLTNSVTLYVVWPRSGQKSGVNILIFHYLIVNLLMILVHYPIRCYMVQARSSYNLTVSKEVCSFVQTFLNVTWYVLYWSDAGLAVNRCIALYFPHQYRTYSTAGKNRFQIILMWSVSLVVVLPLNFDYGGSMLQLSLGHCASRSTKSYYGRFYDGFGYIPHMFDGVASVAILWKISAMSRVRAAAARAGDLTTVGSSSRLQQRIVVARMLVLTYVWSIFSLLPPAVIISVYPQVYQHEPIINGWLQTVVVAQYAMTPCILLISNEKYRERLRGINVAPAHHHSHSVSMVPVSAGAVRSTTGCGAIDIFSGTSKRVVHPAHDSDAERDRIC